MHRVALLLLGFLPVAVASAAGPVGPLIVFASQSEDIVVQHLDGSGRVTLSGGAGPAGSPAWSANGTKVAFGTNRQSSRVGLGEIYVVSADGSGLHAVTSAVPAGHERYDPVWSPDGSQIAYLEASTASGPPSADVWIVPASGGTPRRMTADGSDKRGIAWQPNGPLLLFDRAEASGWGLWTIDTSSGVERRLADVAPFSAEPGSWSPDGAFVAFTDSAGRAVVVAADGTGPHVVSTLRVAGTPVWSPDGTSLAFAASRVLDGPYGRYGPPVLTDVYAASVTLGAAHRLTGAFDGQVVGFQSFAPVWLPDRSGFLYRTDDPSGFVRQMNADGTCEVPSPAIPPATSRYTFQPGVAFGGGPRRCVDLRVRIAAVDGTVGLGRPADAKLIVENDGNLPATGVVVTISASGDVVSSIADAQIGTMAPGEQHVLTLSLSSRHAGNATATVVAVANEPDPTPENAHATVATSVLNCTLVGTWGADTLVGTRGADRICGLPGPDRIEGGKGADYIDAGNGNDTVVGGPGRDTIITRGGRDVIDARDGALDWIDCGTEYDIAIVDRVDHTHHCERVVRR